LIDDITVTADGAASGYPFSTVGEMSSYYASSDIQVPVTVANTDSLVLYYRAGDGEWTKYADDAHPDGEFPAAPLVFRAPADGQYELYSVAAGSGLQEDMKAGAEAAFTIDTKAPTVAVTAPVQGSVIVPGAISLEWTAGDDGSGIARTEVSVDGGSWTEVPATPYSTGPLADGERSVEVRVTDSVGWTARSSVAFVVDPSAPAMTVSPIGPGAPLGAAVVALFQEAVDQDSVAVEVGGVAGRLSWDGDKVAFAPSEPLEPERTYSVAVTGNKAGGDSFSVEWSFTTVKNSGGISGTVRASDGRAVANATVALSNGAATITDAVGHFELGGIVPGDYILTVSGKDYETMSIDVSIAAGQIEELGVLNVKTGADRGAGPDIMTTALLLTLVAGPSLVLLAVFRKRKWI
jgi:hypothetical protein